jgi:translocation and assembly module TamA
MKAAKPASLWTIARPLAGACLLATTAGCALVPGLRDAVVQEGEKRPRAALEGVPPELAARANELVRVDEPPPRSVLEARNRMNNSAVLVRDLMSSEGYLAADIMPSRIESTSDTAVLVAEPGPLFTVLSRDFAGRDAIVPEVAKTLDKELATLPPRRVSRSWTTIWCSSCAGKAMPLHAATASTCSPPARTQMWN